VEIQPFFNTIGHEDLFTPPRLSAGYRLDKPAFAGTQGNGRDAPKAGTLRHAASLPGLASKAVVRVLQPMAHRDYKLSLTPDMRQNP
jgi:hypothetical protein